MNTGDGKGKLGAFGVMIRGVARGWHVGVVQFVKSGDWRVGEEEIGRRLGVDWNAVGDGFTWDSADLDHDQRARLARAGPGGRADRRGAHQLVILDELTYLCTWGWIDAADVVAAIRDRPAARQRAWSPGATRRPSSSSVADTVTEMREVKHAYDSGITALRGIDY